MSQIKSEFLFLSSSSLLLLPWFPLQVRNDERIPSSLRFSWLLVLQRELSFSVSLLFVKLLRCVWLSSARLSLSSLSPALLRAYLSLLSQSGSPPRVSLSPLSVPLCSVRWKRGETWKELKDKKASLSFSLSLSHTRAHTQQSSITRIYK